MGLWGKNRQAILLVGVVLVLMGLLMFSAQDGARVSLVERLIVRAMAPVQGAAASVVDLGRRLGRFVLELGDLRRDNERMRVELDELRFKYINLVEAELEAERLRELLAYRQTRPELPLTMARIISRGLVAWHSEVIIDRGTRHGIRVGDPVVTPVGAVGRIIEVRDDTATVLLITDPRSGVAAMVQENRLAAIAEGDPSRLGMVRLPRLPRDFDIAVGDLITTSGLGGVFPREQVFIIGSVQEIFVSADGLLKFARIRPAVDISRLEEVLVMRRGAP
ncbi:MAG: Cell shape-determining protein MreC [Firmicutes bacterium]|nr:Cell shape-determining protein MreC [Bacillota bacterium]